MAEAKRRLSTRASKVEKRIAAHSGMRKNDQSGRVTAAVTISISTLISEARKASLPRSDDLELALGGMYPSHPLASSIEQYGTIDV